MADKQQFVDDVSKLPGVGPKTAEKLYDSGFDSIEKLKGASVEELVEKGVGKKTAEAIVKGLAEQGAPAPKGEIEVVEAEERKTKKGEKKTKAAGEAVEVVEKPYAPKLKAELDDETKRLLHVRKLRAAREPEFKKYQWFRYKKLDDAWRRPRGPSNKQRRHFNYRPPMVKNGWGKPASTRGLHPSGFAEVLVHNVAELGVIDPKKQAARIGGTVGGRKRKLIETAAAEKGIRVLNPRGS